MSSRARVRTQASVRRNTASTEHQRRPVASRKGLLLAVGAVVVAAPLLTAPATATPAATARPVRVSGTSPLAGCDLDGTQPGRLFTNA